MWIYLFITALHFKITYPTSLSIHILAACAALINHRPKTAEFITMPPASCSAARLQVGVLFLGGSAPFLAEEFRLFERRSEPTSPLLPPAQRPARGGTGRHGGGGGGGRAVIDTADGGAGRLGSRRRLTLPPFRRSVAASCWLETMHIGGGGHALWCIERFTQHPLG